VTNRDAEYAILRRTIADRGTTRVVLQLVSLVSWATLATILGLYSDVPLLTVVPLGVLCAGYEAVWSLHVGVERVGRFIQVVYESAPGGPTWETMAMRAGSLPGSGTNPLFSLVFGGASLVNLGAAFVVEPTALELVILAGCHALFLIRLAQTRVTAGRQRRADVSELSAIASALGRSPLQTETSSDYEKS
jgi:hypothetical protein